MRSKLVFVFHMILFSRESQAYLSRSPNIYQQGMERSSAHEQQ